MSELKDKIRAKTVGSSKVFKFKMVQFDEMEIEIREPSVRDWGKIMKAVMSMNSEEGSNKMEYDKYLIWSVIYCAFVPGSDEKVYEDTDYDALANFPRSGFVGEFSEIAMDMMNSDSEQTEKNSEKTATDKTS